MTPEIKIELTDEAIATVRMLDRLPAAMLTGIARALDFENQLTISHIVQDYLSFPKDQPATPIGLRVQTGLGRRSIRASQAVIVGQSVVSAIGSPVEYMAAHEFGAEIPAHDIVAKGKALRFQIGGRVIFRKKVHIPATTLPERAPIQRGIADRADDYGRAISEAIMAAWNEGGQN